MIRSLRIGNAETKIALRPVFRPQRNADTGTTGKLQAPDVNCHPVAAGGRTGEKNGNHKRLPGLNGSTPSASPEGLQDRAG